MSAVTNAFAQKSVILPHADWIEPLTKGFPAGLDWSLELDPCQDDGNIAFLLRATKGGGLDPRLAFFRKEVLNYENGTTEAGRIQTFTDVLGEKRLGARYMLNLAEFVRDALGFSQLRLMAGDTLGGKRWLEVAEVDPAIDGYEAQKLLDHLNRRLRLASDDLPGLVYGRMRGLIDGLFDKNDPRRVVPERTERLRAIAADPTPLSRNGDKSTSQVFCELAAYHKQKPVPLGDYMLVGSHWPGVIDLADDRQMSALARMARP